MNKFTESNNLPAAHEWINEYRDLKAENKRLHEAVKNYDIANIGISRELNETRLRLAKAEMEIEKLTQRIEKLTRVNVETIVE